MGMLCKVEHVGREDKVSMMNDWDVHSADDLLGCLGDFNRHIGGHIDGLDGVHGGNGAGQRNLEGRMLLQFCLDEELCVKVHGLRERRRGA